MSNSTDTQRERIKEESREWYKKCVLGSHILHHHGVLDAYGHLSFRHPSVPGTFVMPRNIAPALISSEQDLVQYRISDASPIGSDPPRGYIERYIHSEIYKRYPHVYSIIHSHAKEVLPYTISGVPLRPCLHMSGFLGTTTPIFDIARHYQTTDTRDLLIKNVTLGKSLASFFSSADTSSENAEERPPDHSVVLMRGHGFTVAAVSIEQSVFQAVYTKENACIQTASLCLQAAYRADGGTVPKIQYLHDDEIEGTCAIPISSGDRAWNLWVKEVENTALYSLKL